GGFCAMEGEDPETPMPQAMGGSGKGVVTDREAALRDGLDEALADFELRPVNGAGTDDSAAGDSAGALKNMRAFNNKRIWQRALILAAGAIMNLILGFALLVGYFAFCLPENRNGEILIPTRTVVTVENEALPLLPEDVILSINGRHVFSEMDIRMFFQNSDSRVFDLTVRRQVDGETRKIKLEKVDFTVLDEKTGQERFSFGFRVLGETPVFGNVLAAAARTEVSMGFLVWHSLGDLIRGRYGLNDLSGPVGTIDIIGKTVDGVVSGQNTRLAVGDLLMLITLITVNVGVFNLLPFPGLDGGRLMFLLYEAIARKPVPPKYEGIVHFIGLILLLLLMLVVTFSDVLKLF
ncbi:MAG: M50 family metallopeptidase, partial [Oscillospiraceae bacterium]|nr:M50 family metallopeptidase [Oscillospiraceae bacterium]